MASREGIGLSVLQKEKKMVDMKAGKVAATAVEIARVVIKKLGLGNFLSRFEFGPCGPMGGYQSLLTGMTDTGTEVGINFRWTWVDQEGYDFFSADLYVSHRTIPPGKWAAPWQGCDVMCRYDPKEGIVCD